MSIMTDLFQLEVPFVEKVIRSILVYFFLIIALRLAGKRELAQINTFDLVVLLTLSNTVQNAIIGNDTSLLGGIIGAATLLFINYVLVRFLSFHPWLTQLIEGKPDVLISSGKVNHKRLKQEGITLQELKSAANRQGFASLSLIEKAILESSGAISFIAKTPTEDTARHQELMQRMDQLEQLIKSMPR